MGGCVMGSIILEVKGAFANFKLEHDEIKSYEFAYSVSDSKYAKGSKDKRELVIKGSIPRTLARNETAMKEIREWAKEKYKDPSYYSYVKVTAMYRDDVVRTITFPNAFIKSYEEEINPHSGDGIYTLTLLQKIDKRIDIIVDPFNVVHPTLSELTAKRRDNAVATAASPPLEDDVPMNPPLPAEDEEPRNSPYWVERNSLVHSRIRIVGTGARMTSGNISIPANIPQGSEFDVIGAERNANGISRYNIGGNRWINNSNDVREIGNTRVKGTRMIVVPRNTDGLVSVEGYWDPARLRGQEDTLQVLNTSQYERAGRNRDFDALAGTRSTGSTGRGLIGGAAVILEGREAPHEGRSMVEVTKWGDAASMQPRYWVDERFLANEVRVVSTTYVGFRAGPTTGTSGNASRIRTIPNGTILPVRLVRENEGVIWYYVEYSDCSFTHECTGWVAERSGNAVLVEPVQNRDERRIVKVTHDRVLEIRDEPGGNVIRPQISQLESAISNRNGRSGLKHNSQIRVISEDAVEENGVRWVRLNLNVRATGGSDLLMNTRGFVVRRVNNGLQLTFPRAVTGNIVNLRPVENWAMFGSGRYYPQEVGRGIERRLNVAVGPRIVDYTYSNCGRLQKAEFLVFAKRLDVVLKLKETGEERIIRCIVHDIKAHSYNQYPHNTGTTANFDVENGVVQTGIAYPNRSGGGAVNTVPDHSDSSIIEFCGREFDSDARREFQAATTRALNELYELVRIIVLD